MALMACFTHPGTVSDMLGCLHEKGDMSSFLAVLLALGLWGIACIRATAEGKKTDRQDMRVVLAVPCPPPFGSRAHADAIYLSGNRDLYQVLLVTLEKALHKEGYGFTPESTRRTPLTSDSQQRVARAVFVAREHHMVPCQTDSVVEEKARLAARDGYAEQLLYLLTTGSEKLGWYITRMDDVDRGEKCDAIPNRLTQITVSVRATSVLTTQDMARAFSAISGRIRAMCVDDGQEKVIATGALSGDLHYDAILCFATAPGWLPEACGRTVPVTMAAEPFPAALSSGDRHFIIRVQGSRYCIPDTLADFFDEACQRITAGEVSGADYDDDNGYVFTVVSPEASH